MSLSLPPSLMPLAGYSPAQVPNQGWQTLPWNAPLSFSPSSPYAPGSLVKQTLANGSQGYFFQKPGIRKSALVLSFPIKSLPPVVSDLLTGLLFGGSPSTKRQLEDLERQGISISHSKTDTQLTIHVAAPAGQEAAMTAAVLRLLTQPVVDPATFNTLKTKFIQGQQSLQSNPDALLGTRMAQRIFGPDHPYSLTPQALIADASGQTLPGVLAYQPALLQLMQQGKAMMISPLPAESQRQTLDDALIRTNLARTGASAGALVNRADVVASSSPRTVLQPNDSVQRALIKVLWQVPDPRDPDYPVFCLIKSLLNGTSQNSFFKTLRTDHSLVYAINCHTEKYQLPQGDTYTPGVKVEFSKIGQALADIRQVTQELCQNPIPTANLQAIQRAQLLELREGGETAGDLGYLYHPWLTRAGADAPAYADMQAAINRVTPADIQRVANHIFNNPRNLQLMGVSAPGSVLQQWFPGQPLEKP